MAGRDGVQHLLIRERRQTRRHLRIFLHDAERRRIVNDLQPVPDRFNRLIQFTAAVRQREHAHDLWEPGIRRGADQQPARLVARLASVAAQPGPRAAANPQGEILRPRGLVHAPLPAAFATNDLFRQIAAGAAFVQPQLSPAWVVAAVHEGVPVDVVHMTSGAGADETGGHNVVAGAPAIVVESLESSPGVQQLAVYDTPGAGVPAIPIALLHHKPLREAPRADAALLLQRTARLRWRSVKPGMENPRHLHQLRRQPRFGDFLQVRAPGLQSADDGGVSRQVDQRARPERRDGLAAAYLPAFAAVHPPPPSRVLGRSCT